jgi:hypothetical protein
LAYQHESHHAHIQGMPLEKVDALPASPNDHPTANPDPNAIIPQNDEVGYPRMLTNLILNLLVSPSIVMLIKTHSLQTII